MCSLYKYKVLEEKCPACPNHLRKIEEVEQLLSGREAIITVLKVQLTKWETNYKTLFTNYEQLRFEHSSALQDNFSLQEINSKLKHITISEKKSTNEDTRYSESEADSNLSQDIESLKKSSKASRVAPLLKKVVIVENLVKSQNTIISQLIETVIEELGCYKGSNPNNTEESGDYLIDTDSKSEKLQAEAEKLKALVEEYEKENIRMKETITDKTARLTQCTNISFSANSIMDTNSNPSDEIALNTSDTDYGKKLSQLQKELEEKDKYYEDCNCQLLEQLQDMHDNNQNLSDTLVIITDENKNNMEIIANLKAELNRVNEECDEKTEAMKVRINQLENDLEESRIAKKELKNSIDLSENEVNAMTNRIKLVLEENDNLRNSQNDTINEFKTKLMDLEAENIVLRKELDEKNLELTEYEEENRNLCQKMEILNNSNSYMARQVRELEHELMEIKELEKEEMAIQMSSTDVELLEEQVRELEEDRKCLAEKCVANKREIDEKIAELDSIKNSVVVQEERFEKLRAENEALKREMERMKNENKKEIEKLQDMLNHSQKQVGVLLKEHDAKTAEIENVANELDVIRRSVTEDNEKFADQIRQFEVEREDLQKKVKEHEHKQCNCHEGAVEIERLNAELYKKQCIILELEKSIDEFNNTVKNFDQTAEELASENNALKKDLEKRDNEIQLLHVKLSEKVHEPCPKLESLKAKKEELTNQNQLLLSRIRNLEVDNKMLKDQLDRITLEKGQLEKTCLDNYQLQMEVDRLKENNARRDSVASGKLANLQKAYDELKNLHDQKNLENGKLKSEIKQCSTSFEETKMICRCLQKENQMFKKNVVRMSAESDELKLLCDNLKKDCVKKCLEIECLKQTVEENRTSEENYNQLKQNNILKDKQLAELREKMDEYRKNSDQKSQELKKIRKQWESSAKQCQISRDEYNNLRKEYKEIKTMLSDQIKKYRLDSSSLEPTQQCQVVADLKEQLLKKERQMLVLQQNVKDAAYEIIELKDYIHKLMCDNNVLKSGINNLIGNLERKIKGPSFGSLPSNSAEAIAGEILHSLSNIENITDACPKGCQHKNCSCMLEIISQYKDSHHSSDNVPKNENYCETSTSPTAISKYTTETLPLQTLSHLNTPTGSSSETMLRPYCKNITDSSCQPKSGSSYQPCCTETGFYCKSISKSVKVDSGATTDSDDRQSASSLDQK